MPAGNPAGYFDPRLISDLSGVNAPQSGGFSPGMQDRMSQGLSMRGANTAGGGLDAELLRRLREVERTRTLEDVRQRSQMQTGSAEGGGIMSFFDSFNPFARVSDALGGG